MSKRKSKRKNRRVIKQNKFSSNGTIAKKISTLYHYLIGNRYFVIVIALLGFILGLISINMNLFIVEALILLTCGTAIIGLYRSVLLSGHLYLFIIISIALIILSVVTDIYVIRPNYYYSYYLKPGSKKISYDENTINSFPDIKVYLGGNTLSFDYPHKIYPILTYDYENILSLKLSEDGLLISAKVFDPDGKAIAVIKDNKFVVNKNDSFVIDRPNVHELYVINKSGRRFLGVKFMNSYEVAITGIFSLENYPSVEITKESIEITGTGGGISGSKFTNVGVLIRCKRKFEETAGYGVSFAVCGE